MKVLYSGFRWPHHSTNGGYDRVINFPDADYISNNDVLFRKNDLKDGLKRKINLRLLDIATKILHQKYDITHLIYTEQQLYYPYLKSKKHKVVGTIHLDFNNPFFSRRMHSLKSLDTIIVLKNDFVDLVSEKTGVQTVFIPHGFDKPVFKEIIPQNTENKLMDIAEINVSVIGVNYRDYNIIEYILKNKTNKDIVFHFVGQYPKTIEKLKVYKNVRFYNYLDNDEYYTLISLCDYNFLPLTFATANNVLMEAQSLGALSILPRISGILDYGSPDNIYYSSFEELLQMMDTFHILPQNFLII
jgi:hypothetical protein